MDELIIELLLLYVRLKGESVKKYTHFKFHTQKSFNAVLAEIVYGDNRGTQSVSYSLLPACSLGESYKNENNDLIQMPNNSVLNEYNSTRINLQCTIRFLEADSSLPLSIVNLLDTVHLIFVCPFLALIVYESPEEALIVSSKNQR